MNSCFAAERYEAIPLPFIPFSNRGGEALSNHGVVAGGIANADGSVSLAEWSNGVLTSLGVPPGFPSRDFNTPRVFGINDCGVVVGTLHTSAGEIPSRWFIYDRGRFTVLPLADPTDLGGAAIGINNRGEVVGLDHTSSRRETAWLWSNGVYSRLPVSGNGEGPARHRRPASADQPGWLRARCKVSARLTRLRPCRHRSHKAVAFQALQL